jgi:hypothetical protein
MQGYELEVIDRMKQTQGNREVFVDGRCGNRRWSGIVI